MKRLEITEANELELVVQKFLKFGKKFEFFEWLSQNSSNTSLDSRKGGAKYNVYDQLHSLISDQFSIIVLDVNTKLLNENNSRISCENWRLLFLNDANEQRLKALLIFKLVLKLASINQSSENTSNVVDKLRQQIDETKRLLASRLMVNYRAKILAIIEEIDFEIVSVSESDGEMLQVNDVRILAAKEKANSKKKALKKKDRLKAMKISSSDVESDKSQKIYSEIQKEEHEAQKEKILNGASGNRTTCEKEESEFYGPKVAIHDDEIEKTEMNEEEETIIKREAKQKSKRKDECKHL